MLTSHPFLCKCQSGDGASAFIARRDAPFTWRIHSALQCLKLFVGENNEKSDETTKDGQRKHILYPRLSEIDGDVSGGVFHVH